jgi:hypothetical protein
MNRHFLIPTLCILTIATSLAILGQLLHPALIPINITWLLLALLFFNILILLIPAKVSSNNKN